MIHIEISAIFDDIVYSLDEECIGFSPQYNYIAMFTNEWDFNLWYEFPLRMFFFVEPFE